MRNPRPLPPLVVVVAAVLVLSLAGAAPVLAHDESVPGTPDVTITVGPGGLSDRDVRIPSESIVRFVNRDDERHRMRARSGPAEFDSGDLESGESFQVRLTMAGTYRYADERDRDDAGYRGRIVVEERDGGGRPAASGGTVAGGGAAAGGSAAPSSATVTIGDDFFDPGAVRVAVGGTVVFENTGGEEHSATGVSFDTGVLSGGSSARATFPTAGVFDFLCIFHSDMRGTIEVVGAAPSAPVATSAPTPTPAASATPGVTPSTAATGEPAPDGVAGPVEVAIVDFAFEAADVVVRAGGTVVWRNTGVAPHTATADDGTWDSGMLAAGDTFEHTFDAPGRSTYLCAVHPDMTGSIEVVAEAGAPAATPSAAAPATAVAAGASAPPVPSPGSEAGSVGATAPTRDVSGLAGIVLTVALVSIAAGLFSRVVRGTIRQAE